MLLVDSLALKEEKDVPSRLTPFPEPLNHIARSSPESLRRYFIWNPIPLRPIPHGNRGMGTAVAMGGRLPNTST